MHWFAKNASPRVPGKERKDRQSVKENTRAGEFHQFFTFLFHFPPNGITSSEIIKASAPLAPPLLHSAVNGVSSRDCHPHVGAGIITVIISYGGSNGRNSDGNWKY